MQMPRIQLNFTKSLPQSHKSPLVLGKQTVSTFGLKFTYIGAAINGDVNKMYCQ